MAPRSLIAEVALPVSIALDATFDYIVPQRLSKAARPGLRVRVPFRNRTLTGFLVAIKKTSPFRKKCRPIESLVDTDPLLDETLWSLAQEMRRDYACAFADVLNAFLPQSIRSATKQASGIEATPLPADASRQIPLTDTEEKILREIPPKPAITVMTDPSDTKRWAVYAALIKDTLNSRKSVILTVPQHEMLERIGQLLPGLPEPLVLSSYRKPKALRQDWTAARLAPFCFVAGTRSAVLAPVRGLGLIIIDQESHFAYHQDQAPCYRAADIAMRRLRGAPGRLVMGSVLPSLENEMLCENGKALFLSLPAQDTGPQVTLLDLTRAPDARGERTGLSQALTHRLSLALQEKEKVLAVTHQKCYVSALYCRRCRKAVMCPRCSVPLKEYRQEKTLRCGICGHREQIPDLCPACHRSYVRHIGFGSEKTLSEIQKLFPGAAVKTWDVARREPGDCDIILATPALLEDADTGKACYDRVFVLDADQPLAMADFRAAERAFTELWRLQLLARKELCLQTRWPEHYVFTFLKDSDDSGFRKRELKERAELSWPPLRPLASLTVRSASEKQARREALRCFRALCDDIGASKDVEICEPAAARPLKVRGNYRYQVFVKAADLEAVRRTTQGLMKKVRSRAHLIFDPNGG